MRAICSSTCDTQFASALAQVNAANFSILVAERDLGMSADEARGFVAAKPLVLRYFMAHALYSVRAAQRGSKALLQTAAKKELNNQLDLEYGIVATYFDGFLTNDHRARGAFESLREMIDRPLDEAVQIVNRVLRERGKPRSACALSSRSQRRAAGGVKEDANARQEPQTLALQRPLDDLKGAQAARSRRRHFATPSSLLLGRR